MSDSVILEPLDHTNWYKVYGLSVSRKGRVDKVGKEAIEIGASTSAAIMMTLLETRRKTWYNWMVKSR